MISKTFYILSSRPVLPYLGMWDIKHIFLNIFAKEDLLIDVNGSPGSYYWKGAFNNKVWLKKLWHFGLCTHTNIYSQLVTSLTSSMNITWNVTCISKTYFVKVKMKIFQTDILEKFCISNFIDLHDLFWFRNFLRPYVFKWCSLIYLSFKLLHSIQILLILISWF